MVDLIDVTTPRLELWLNAAATVTVGAKVRFCFSAGMNLPTLLLSDFTERSTMSAGLVPVELVIVRLKTDYFWHAFRSFLGSPLRTISCAPIGMESVGWRWTLSIGTVPASAVDISQDGGKLSILPFLHQHDQELRPDFGEMARGVWMMPCADSPEQVSFCELLWCCCLGGQWCTGNFSYSH